MSSGAAGEASEYVNVTESDGDGVCSDDVRSLISDERPVLIVDDAFPDLSNQCAVELQQLCNNGDMKPACMGRGGVGVQWQQELFRGDRVQWVSPDVCRTHNLTAVTALIKKLIKICGAVKRENKRPQSITDYSVQLALYPGNGAAYTRHCDASSKPDADVMDRQLTLIYYLNSSWSGGQLRVYLPGKHPDNETGKQCMDIEPIRGRLVVFKSRVVEHEVLPTNSERIALTMWASGRGPLWPINEQTLSPSSLSLSANRVSTLSETSNSVFVRNAYDDVESFKLTEEIIQRQSGKTVFVSVASYRDPELQRTVAELFFRANDPGRVFVGVVLQLYPDSDTEEMYGLAGVLDAPHPSASPSISLKQWMHSNLRLVRLHAEHARGPCWARSLARSLWSGESFYLQVDAHMRFRRCWDTYLLELHDMCTTLLANGDSDIETEAVISTYPPGYDPDGDPPTDIRPTLLVPSHFDDDGILRQKARQLRFIGGQPLRHQLWAAGFSFSRSRVMVQDVPYDPMLQDLFFGEEISMAARLFTRGVACFAPPQTVVYHLWSRAHRPSERHDPDKPGRVSRKLKSQRRVKALLGMSPEERTPSGYCESMPMFELGSARSIHEFEKELKVNFSSQTIFDGADCCGLSPEVFADDVGDVLQAIPDRNTLGSQNSNISPKLQVLSLVQSLMLNPSK